MKIRELQKKLNELDQELEVVCYCEEETFLIENRGFILLDILAVGATEAERLRLDDGTPYLKFGKGSNSSVIATLEVTKDF